MSQDISYIKQELKVCEEVDSPYDIKNGQHVKYITITDGDEYFHEGGIYSKMGDNIIILKEGSKTITVPLIYQNKGGFTVYRTRLFVRDEKKMNGGGKNCSAKDAEEYEKIIQTQQKIIEKMNLHLKQQAQMINKLSPSNPS